MKYTCELSLNAPRETVAAAMRDLDNMEKWQEGFIAYRALDDDPNAVGGRVEIDYQMGKRPMTMLQTVTRADLPSHLAATYEAGAVWNLVECEFIDQGGGKTHWILTSEFRCKGFMRIFAALFPGMFRKQTEKYMSDFKAFVEGARNS